MRDQAVKYIRPHYLLDVVGYNPEAKGKKKYDWTKLDIVLDRYVANGFKPIFEMMGNPGGHFDNFQKHSTVMEWHQLVIDLAKHLEDRYGKEEIRSWYFESTNEPDRWHFWDDWMIAFLNYYDATSEALLKVDSNIVFGGPGTADGLDTYMYLLLDHAKFGRNYITKERGSRLDFISLHNKALPADIVKEEDRLIQHMHEYAPYYLDTPVMNNEADPIAGWGKDYWWRSSPWYAAFVAQSVDYHIRTMRIKRNTDYRILSNDNGFLGDWYKRTLMARFIKGDNGKLLKGASSIRGSKLDKEEDNRQVAHRFYLVKKPVLTVMNLLTYLGNEAFVLDSNVFSEYSGAIATKHSNGDMAILCYNTPQFDLDDNFSKTIPDVHQKTLQEAKDASFTIDIPAEYQSGNRMIAFDINEKHGNPYKIWENMGSPEDPSQKQIQKLIKNENPALTENTQLNNDQLDLTIQPMAVKLIYIFNQNKSINPQPVKNLNINYYKGLNNEPVMVLTWKADNKKPVHYKVYYKPDNKSEYTLLNDYHLSDNHFTWVNCKQKGKLKVVTQTYDGRSASAAVKIKKTL